MLQNTTYILVKKRRLPEDSLCIKKKKMIFTLFFACQHFFYGLNDIGFSKAIFFKQLCRLTAFAKRIANSYKLVRYRTSSGSKISYAIAQPTIDLVFLCSNHTSRFAQGAQ